MPVTPTYPGVYIEEVPSGVRTIVGVETSIAAFLGSAQRGPTNDPKTIANFGDFERNFGPLQVNSSLGYAVQQFFQNGGSKAVVVRLANEDAAKAKLDVGGLLLEASGDGVWGDNIRARVDYQTKDPADPDLFNLFVRYEDEETNTVINEQFRNISVNRNHPRFVETILEERSDLVSIDSEAEVPADRPGEQPAPEDGSDPFATDQEGSAHVKGADGADGGPIGNDDLQGNESAKSGIYALEKADLFNLLCLPPPSRNPVEDVSAETYAQALQYCLYRRAFLLVDPKAGAETPDAAQQEFAEVVNLVGPDAARNAAFFFPRVKIVDPLKDNLLAPFAPSAVVAGICARTDAQRGVWKAPAGTEASLSGVRELVVKLTDAENGLLNPLGINCLRNFPVYGNVVWGSRTMAGADRLASEWKYLPVRRFTLFLEESLFRGTQWVVFEPNDEPLWGQIRLNVGGFMQTLFRQGAFQGRSPREAYFVKCDGETTTQDDIDRGIVNIHVGFAPLKPAEFVIIKIQQLTGRENEA